MVIDKKGSVHYYGHRHSNDKTQYSFQADPLLVQLASNYYILENIEKQFEIYKGSIGSSDVWLDNIERVKWTHEFFSTECEDMEASAIAQVAYFE